MKYCAIPFPKGSLLSELLIVQLLGQLSAPLLLFEKCSSYKMWVSNPRAPLSVLLDGKRSNKVHLTQCYALSCVQHRQLLLFCYFGLTK